MFTVADLERRYGVSQSTVLGWIAAGELKAVNVGRRPGAKKPRWRISQAALDAFEAVRTPAGGAAPQPVAKRARRGKGPEVIQFYT
jgi:excisionase family DNA binding protein